MKIVKKINNNVAIGLDNNNQELVVFRKGIGFPKIPYELTDLKKIDKTFYNIDDHYYSLLNEISSDLFEFIYQLIETVKNKKNLNFNPNLVFILSDHINFAIDRYKKGIKVTVPYIYGLEYDYPELYQCAKWIVKNIEDREHIHFESGEVDCITMHLVSALRMDENNEENVIDINTIIEDVTNIIEDYFQIEIDKKGFHYFRFKNHIKYFVKRKENNAEFKDDNLDLYNTLSKEYPQSFDCVQKIVEYFSTVFTQKCSKEEQVYLFLHVDRLCKKEDCYQMGITSKR